MDQSVSVDYFPCQEVGLPDSPHLLQKNTSKWDHVLQGFVNTPSHSIGEFWMFAWGWKQI